MNYDWMTYEEIKKSAYPNLLAEIKESGYSICTISDFMGLGRCKEDNKAVWDKLTGKVDFPLKEAELLAKYFNADFDYLFSSELYIVCDKPYAYLRWYEDNKKKSEDIARSKEIMEIYNELVANPELLEFMKWCKSLTKEQRKEVLQIMQT